MRPSQLSITLKQKLSALSISPSSPSSPLTQAPPGKEKKQRSLFPPSWRRGSHHHHVHAAAPAASGVAGREASEEGEKLQDVMGRLIFQAGVDFEVVMAACALPDPEEVSYDLLLNRVLSYLDLYVESDYTLVFFAAGARHAPSWNWIWKVYRRQLSRKHRKHLKKLYVVHPSFFSKMLFSLAGAVISPKFFRKIQYCATLSSLARYVPLTQIDIPQAVYQENLKHEEGIELPIQPLSTHFGVPLDELMGAYGEKGGVPRVVRDCVAYLRENGMNVEGIFRRSPSSQILKQAQEAYDRGHPVSLETFGDPHLAAVLLKKFFRDLPVPIFPEESYSIIRKCPLPSSEGDDLACIYYIRDYVLPGLGSYSAVILLSYVLHLLHEISLRANVNRMDAHNLAIVFAPNLVKSSNPIRDVQQCVIPGGPSLTGAAPAAPKEGKTTVAMILKCCIQRYFDVFDEVRDRSEAIRPSSLRVADETAGSHPTNDQPSDDDLDDSMLFVPSGLSPPQEAPQPSSQPAKSNGSRTPPSAWGSSGPWPYQPRRPPRHERIASGGGTSHHGLATSPSGQSPSLIGLGVRSMATGGGGGAPEPYPSISKTRSMISIEKDAGPLTDAAGTRRRASIRLGSGTVKGTVGKSAGAAVEALSITASGFFSPPGGKEGQRHGT